MELSKNFQHQDAESKWYQHWMDKGYFYSEPNDQPAYTIVMPPPNVTGVLHMGHALNNTVQDALIRFHKMKGYNTCWVPGTDHASIATEAKVVAMLRDMGIDKNALSREDFLKYAWEWKEKYGGIILSQLKKLGCALDWKRTHFTMDTDYYNAVIDVFIDLYKKGLIYRDMKMINWDPQALTSLSDEEVIHKPVQSKLYHIKYQVEGTNETIIIATVRPETILGDTAICVHPEDPRYAHLKGKRVIVPIVNRSVPVIFDDYIDIEFGTGALKVTPAHDINDYNLGKKYNLEIIDTMNDNGTMNDHGAPYTGMDRFAVRKKIIEDLTALGVVEKIEDYNNQVGFSERTNAVVEPKLRMQWWCNMQELAKPALDAVLNDEIGFVPPKFKNLYRHWMENVRDWNISRQLRWGHRIPAWYDSKGNFIIAKTQEEAEEQYNQKFGEKITLTQDDDVLDTWFSSWLWPMEVFGWNKDPNNSELAYYYPTQTLITAPEIIFFWVARMIMAGYEFMGKLPFEQVYFTGVVRDKQGRKMSKSLGNSPDLLKLIDDFGADAVRFSVLISSPAGNDLLYDESSLDQGRNFGNKMWNAMKLVLSWKERIDPNLVSDDDFANQWIFNKVNQARQEMNQLFTDFRLSEALKTIYTTIWDDYCSWYLEWVKPGFNEPISKSTYDSAVKAFTSLLQLLHPFMPFITEDIYHHLGNEGDLMNEKLTLGETVNQDIFNDGESLKSIISTVRDSRNKNQLKPKEVVTFYADTQNEAFYKRISNILKKQINADAILFTSEMIQGSISGVWQKDKFYLKGENTGATGAQKEQLEKDLAYNKGFLLSVEKKLSNEKFMANAKPEVIALEEKKKADAMEKIRAIEESLANM